MPMQFLRLPNDKIKGKCPTGPYLKPTQIVREKTTANTYKRALQHRCQPVNAKTETDNPKAQLSLALKATHKQLGKWDKIQQIQMLLRHPATKKM